MPDCFIICPIGETGSEIRRNADDLRDLIIQPTLEPLGFNVLRGDHHSEAGQIDIDVIRAVQESDLCIIDISLPNPNVYYEFGRRDETGKPLILLKAKDSGEMPVDIATRRYIEYDLDSRSGLKDARTQLKAFVDPLVKKGFESSGTGTSLSDLAEIMRRVERKVDRIEKKSTRANIGTAIDTEDIQGDPNDVFKLAMRQRNVPLAEKAMQLLAYTTERYRWLDQIVEPVASLGSITAGNIMIENAFDFIDHTGSFPVKLDYITYLITNLGRTDRELENVELVEKIYETLKLSSGNESDENRIVLFNQINRLYYGCYLSKGDTQWLEKSISALNEAMAIDENINYIHYNLGQCYRYRGKEGDKQKALDYILRSIELDGEKNDPDHINSACELLYELSDERLSDYMDMLEELDPVKAQLLRTRFNM